jgi:hypothetical protein
VYDALVKAGILPNTSSSNGHSSNGHTNGNGHSSNGSNGHSNSGNGHSTEAHYQPIGSMPPTEAAASDSTNGNGHHHADDGSKQHSEGGAALTVGSGPAWQPGNPDCPEWRALWDAVCGVWASKWNHRAWLSRQSAGLPEEQLAVSVLVQQVR